MKNVHLFMISNDSYVSQWWDNQQKHGDVSESAYLPYSLGLLQSYALTDDKIKNEFLLKRKKLKNILEDQGHSIEQFDFFETEYSEDFDLFLYETIGYDILRLLTVNLFLGPYSITSIREYFARGFEEYYLGERQYLEKICPYIYKKLYLLSESEDRRINYEF